MRRTRQKTVIKVAVWRLAHSPRWPAKRLANEIAANLQYEGFAVLCKAQSRRRR